MIKGVVELEKFGKLETICQSVYNFEFKITVGFSGTINDNLELQKICSKIAFEYPYISKLRTEKNLFHLILTKLKKT